MNRDLVWPPPSEQQIKAIVELQDAKQRNLQITQTYHELTIALTELFGDQNVTWCAYGTWASKTAGVFIRGEELRAMIEEHIRGADYIATALAKLNHEFPMADHVNELFHATIEEVTSRVSEAVAEGNLLVFRELAPLYRAMLDAFAGATTFDQGKLSAFLSKLRVGDIEHDGQVMLRQAFEHYYKALFATSPSQKAQYVLLGNALAGYHEQTRLQQAIEKSLDAPIDHLIYGRLLGRQEIHQDAHAGFRDILERGLKPLLWPIAQHLKKDWEQICSRWLMSLKLPDVTLRLGANVPPLSDGSSFPKDVATLDYAPLVELVKKLDRTPDSLQGSAAGNWANLNDRMNYVVDFFRSRQQDPNLYIPPYTPAQVEVIHRGGMPEGSL